MEVNKDFTSGFKNQRPWSQSNTNLVGGAFQCSYSQYCTSIAKELSSTNFRRFKFQQMTFRPLFIFFQLPWAFCPSLKPLSFSLTFYFSHNECQKLCDITSHCIAWSYVNNSKHSNYKQCFVKKNSGWRPQVIQDFQSGFRDLGPWYEPDTEFTGGDYKC